MAQYTGKDGRGLHTLNGYSYHELRIIQDEVPDYENNNPYLVAKDPSVHQSSAAVLPLHEAFNSGRARVVYASGEKTAPQRQPEPVRVIRELQPDQQGTTNVVKSKSGYYNSLASFKEWLNKIAPPSSVDAEIEKREARRERKSKRRCLDEGESGAKRLKKD